MSWGAPHFLFGSALAVLVGVLLLWGSVGLRKAVRRFGDPARVYALQTADPSARRAFKGLALVLGTALVFVAAARPQYGKGTRLIPATNIDCVIVLDYSKSMYAQDVEPSRIFRAKIEVARLVKDLPGARFGAVAFAGEPMGLPLSADGAAIAQFFRQLDPNDMPVGGTAIARALEHARNLLNRDPRSADHKRIILLVTDGEDLEGDPVAVARGIGGEGTTVHVVQIGGRTPERIPEVGSDGKITGYRVDRTGKPLQTWLSADGEKQLADIAAATPGGVLVRAERGTTGIEKIAAEIRAQMKGELAERVETVYADIYYVPLLLAIALLTAEAIFGDVAARVFKPRRAPPGLAGAGRAPVRLGGMPSFLGGAPPGRDSPSPRSSRASKKSPFEPAKKSPFESAGKGVVIEPDDPDPPERARRKGGPRGSA
ncbi:MAG: VWA domain-containing protein [Polyangiaceae bacterium]